MKYVTNRKNNVRNHYYLQRSAKSYQLQEQASQVLSAFSTFLPLQENTTEEESKAIYYKAS